MKTRPRTERVSRTGRGAREEFLTCAGGISRIPGILDALFAEGKGRLFTGHRERCLPLVGFFFFFNIFFFLSVLNPAVRCFETILDACTPMSAVRMKVLNGSEKPSRVSGNSGRLSPSVVFTNTFSHTGYTSGHT